MAYSRVKTVDFGASRAGLSSVAWSLNGGSTWSLAGVSESPTGSGIYQATITIPDGFAGTLCWKTGEVAGQRFAAEEINPGIDENSNVKISDLPSAVWSVIIEPAVNNGQPVNARQALSVIGSALSGQLSGEGTNTVAFAAMGNPTVQRIRADISPQGRQPTLTLPS